MSKAMFRAAVLIMSTSILSFTASAGVTSAKIQRILLYEAGMLVYVYPVGGVNDPPACHGNNGDYYSFSISRPMANEYLSALLMAKAADRSVTFFGTGTCEDQGVSETLNYINVK